MYLRDDFLGRPTELRAPTAERAALFLDLALSGRTQGCSSSSNFEPALIYTLHVYQYSLSGKRGGKQQRPKFNKTQFYGLADVLNLAVFLFSCFSSGRWSKSIAPHRSRRLCQPEWGTSTVWHRKCVVGDSQWSKASTQQGPPIDATAAGLFGPVDLPCGNSCPRGAFSGKQTRWGVQILKTVCMNLSIACRLTPIP